MSIIERAIDKAAGVTPAEPEQSAKSVADVEKQNVLIEAFRPEMDAKNRAQESAGVSSAQSATVASAQQASPVSDSAARSEAIEASDTQQPRVASLEPADPNDKNFTHIDLERLAAASFLTPDVGVNGQSEEYQQIKRRLLGNMLPGKGPNANSSNLIMVTSSVPSEGKTFTSVNLSMSIAAEIDHTVLAIDTDIAKRDLTRAFNAVGKPGIFDVLSDDSLSLSDVMLRTNIPNFVLIPAGLNGEGSTELLASVRMHEICQELGSRYRDRVVIFDTPPVLATSAALALAPKMGQVVLVVEAGKTKQETLSDALGLLDASLITGLILNKSKQQRRSAYDYYGYYYQQAP